MVGVYLGIAFIAYWRVWTASTPSLVEPGGLDPQMNMWFLSWTPFALLHGHNPFFTTYGNYPYGVNLLTDTGETLLGLVAAPVTLLFGPIDSFNTMLTLAMASSATAGYVLARRFTTWRPAAFIAGLLYGFSPYMVGQGLYHLNLVFVPLPPLMFLVLYELLIVQRGRPERWGALLALLVCAQFFISSEVLAEAAVIGAVALVVLVVLHPRAVVARAQHAAVGLAVALAISAAVLIGPILYSFHGPGHVTGPVNPVLSQVNRADLLGAVVPNLDQRFAPDSLVQIGNRFAANPPENGSYLGIPLLVLLAAFTVALRRVAVVSFDRGDGRSGLRALAGRSAHRLRFAANCRDLRAAAPGSDSQPHPASRQRGAGPLFAVRCAVRQRDPRSRARPPEAGGHGQQGVDVEVRVAPRGPPKLATGRGRGAGGGRRDWGTRPSGAFLALSGQRGGHTRLLHHRPGGRRPGRQRRPALPLSDVRSRRRLPHVVAGGRRGCASRPRAATSSFPRP